MCLETLMSSWKAKVEWSTYRKADCRSSSVASVTSEEDSTSLDILLKRLTVFTSLTWELSGVSSSTNSQEVQELRLAWQVELTTSESWPLKPQCRPPEIYLRYKLILAKLI